MAELINKHIDKIDAIQEAIQDDADAILREFDLDRFFKNPEKYLEEIADAFLDDHLPELIQAAQEGERFGLEILDNLEP